LLERRGVMKRGVVAFLVACFMLGLLFAPGQARASKDKIKIGSVYILSGFAATYGQFAKQGLLLAADEINKSGGILGKKVEIYFEDSHAKPPIALRAIRKLVYEKGVDFLIGLDSSGVAKGVVPYLKELKVPLIITHAATPDVTGSQCNKYTFRVSVNINQNVMAAAKIAAKTKAVKWTTIGPD